MVEGVLQVSRDNERNLATSHLCRLGLHLFKDNPRLYRRRLHDTSTIQSLSAGRDQFNHEVCKAELLYSPSLKLQSDDSVCSSGEYL